MAHNYFMTKLAKDHDKRERIVKRIAAELRDGFGQFWVWKTGSRYWIAYSPTRSMIDASTGSAFRK